MPPPLSFGDVLVALKVNPAKRFARLGWNGRGMYIKLQVPDENSRMKRPYIYIVPDVDHVVPWVASHADMLTDDWYELPEGATAAEAA